MSENDLGGLPGTLANLDVGAMVISIYAPFIKGHVVSFSRDRKIVFVNFDSILARPQLYHQSADTLRLCKRTDDPKTTTQAQALE